MGQDDEQRSRIVMSNTRSWQGGLGRSITRPLTTARITVLDITLLLLTFGFPFERYKTHPFAPTSIHFFPQQQ